MTEIHSRQSAGGSAVRGATADVVDAVRAMRLDDAPGDALEAARHCLLDWLGVTLAGTGEELAGVLRAELAGEGAGDVPLIGTSLRTSASMAALINGATSHALDYDDTHTMMSGHPSVPVIPAALAIAHRDDRSGADLLLAVMAGIEAECLVGSLVAMDHYQRGWHATGTLGTFGAAAAAATLLDLDRGSWLHAFGLAGTQAAGLKDVFGTMAKPLHAGKAAFNGLLAATLARAGFTSSTDILESPTGFPATFAAPPRQVAIDGATWAVRQTLFKYHASCYLTHGVIESTKKISVRERLATSDVEAVRLAVSPHVLDVCNIAEPATGLEGKFSLRACTAMVLLGDDTSDMASFNDARMRSPELAAMRDRVEVVPTEAQMPTGGVVMVETTDGRRFEATTDMSVPADDLAWQWERLSEKFMSLASPVLGDDGAGRLRGMVAGIDQLRSVRELSRAACPTGREEAAVRG